MENKGLKGMPTDSLKMTPKRNTRKDIKKNPMRWKWILGIAALAIVLFVVAVYVYLNTYDYNKLKPLIAKMVEDATGRKLILGGEVNLELGLLAPFVHLGANDAHICDVQSIGQLGLKSPAEE